MENLKLNKPNSPVVISVLVFILFASSTAIFYSLSLSSLDKNSKDVFNGEVARIDKELSEHVIFYRNILSSMKGLFLASEAVNEDEFRNYISSIAVSTDYNPVTSFMYIEKVKRLDIPKFLREIKSDELVAGYNLSEGVTANDERYIVKFAEPAGNANTKVIGSDFSAKHLESINEAIETNNPVLTEIFINPYLNINEIVIIVPVNRNESIAGTFEAKKNQVRGFVALAFKTKDVLDDIFFPSTSDHLINTDIFEGNKVDSQSLIYSNSLYLRDYKPEYTLTEFQKVGGSYWTIRYSSAPGFAESVAKPEVPIIIILTGTAISFLMSIMAYLILNSRKRALKLAERMTGDLSKSEESLKRSTRALLTISGANQVIVKATGEEKLLQGVCDALIKNAGYRLVWVGYAQKDKEKTVRVAAWAGYSDGYVENLEVLWSEDSPRGNGPTGKSIRENKIILTPDITKDPNFEPWLGEALKRGYLGSIAIPLEFENKVIGALNIYSSMPDVFSEDEVMMLKELADDLAYSISSIRIRAEKEEAVAELKKTAVNLEQFKLAVDSASDHIIITDPAAKIIYANRGATRITGYSNDELLGKTPALWGGQMPKEFYEKMWHTIKIDKQPFIGELTNKKKNGQLYQAEFSASPILDEKGEIIYFVGVERDITKAKEIEKSKNEFVSLASHQLRTPLTAINWYAEMLLGGDAGELNLKQKDYLKELAGSSRRMTDLVSALLNVSRIDLGTFTVNPQPTDVAKICQEVIKDLFIKINKKKLNIVEKCEKLPEINVDPNLINIIMQNLISNSVKYTKDEGTIKISIGERDENIVLTVEDNGYGIPASQQDRVFEKFFRGDNIIPVETDGNGLGLYMVKQILDTAGGSISFSSKEGVGTIFEVKIPMSGMRGKEGSRILEQKGFGI